MSTPKPQLTPLSDNPAEHLWLSYARACYPQGMTEDQEYHMRSAFYAGMKESLRMLKSIGNMPLTKDQQLLLAKSLEDCLNEVVKKHITDSMLRKHGGKG